jgi:hypothetical protein
MNYIRRNIVFYLTIYFILFSHKFFAANSPDLLVGGNFVFDTGLLRESKNEFILESAMISFVDGKSYGVSGDVFGLMLQNRREIRKRLYGFADSAKGEAAVKTGKEDAKRVGMYDFCGSKYCLIDLVQIESKNKKENKEALLCCLETAKEDFISITKNYVRGVNAIKDYLLTLIEEFCQKKGIEECFLLRWGECEAGQEEAIIRNEIVTFKEFSQFCIDLSDFLEVLAKSCPKGKALFVEMVKKAKNTAH